jgi:hypothetical protein
MGRIKRQWKDDTERQVYKLALLGATEKEIADFLQMSISGLNYWKRTKPGFMDKIQQARMRADAQVAKSFHKLATGFWKEEDVFFMYKGVVITKKVEKFYPPNAYAAHKWLTTRRREEWADIHLSKAALDINIKKIDTSDLSDEELKLAEKIGLKMITESGLNIQE